MPEPALIQYWHEEEVPDYIGAELRTFADLNPGFRHLVFSQASAEEFIAEHFSAREVAAFRSCAVPSMQSDYIRFCSGLVLAGIYSDVDFRCTAPVDPLLPERGAIRFFRGPKGNVITGLFAFRAPGHPFLRLALEIVTANIERRFPGSVYFATGPPVVEALFMLHEAGSYERAAAGLTNPRVRKALRAYWEAIGDYRRLAEAIGGVELRPKEEYQRFVRSSKGLAYKQTELHWLNAKGDIFKAP